MLLSQKEAVFNAVINVCGTKDSNTVYNPSREERARINAILVEGFKSGTIEISKHFEDAELKAYVSGLQSNWLRKDKRLNGGTVYMAKNPGSRVGSSDPQLKAMRTLLSTLTDPSEIAEIQTHIDARVKELASAKVKTAATIDYSALPAELQAKFKK